jgi:hypothetical protein
MPTKQNKAGEVVLLELQASNVQILKAFSLRGLDTRHMTKVVGKNEAGKSTVLNLLEMLFQTESVPDEVLTHGENKGGIIGKLKLANGDVIVASRRFTQANLKGQLKLYYEDSPKKEIKEPMTFIKEVLKSIGFNPEDFFTKSKDEQKEIYLKITGTGDELKRLDSEYGIVYLERRDANTEVARIKGALAKLPKDLVYTKKPDISKVLEAKKRGEEINAEHQLVRDSLATSQTERDDEIESQSNYKDELVRIDDEITDLEKRIEAAKKRKGDAEETLRQSQNQHKALDIRIKEIGKEIDNLDPDIDLTTYDTQIAGFDRMNNDALLWEQKVALEKELTEANVKAKAKEKLVQTNRDNREKLLKEAQYPIEGLEYTDEGLRYKGTLIQSLSQTAKIKVATAIYKSMNPALKVMLIDEAGSFDEDNFEWLENFAKEEGLHVLCAMVKNKVKCDKCENGITEDFETCPECKGTGKMYIKGSEIIIEDGEEVYNGYEV